MIASSLNDKKHNILLDNWRDSVLGCLIPGSLTWTSIQLQIITEKM